MARRVLFPGVHTFLVEAFRARARFGLALALLALPNPVAAADPVVACQRAIAKAGAGLVQATLRAEQACLDRAAQGRLAPGLQCLDSGPSTDKVTDPSTLAHILAAVAKARSVVEKRCAGVDVSAPPPSGLGSPSACTGYEQVCTMAVRDLPSLLDCFECSHLSAAQSLVGVEYAPGMRSAPAAGVRRVDQATGNDNGQCGSDTQPCRTIQRAVNLSVSGDEIRVATGTYAYDGSLDPCGAIGTTAVVCILNKQLAILGGYAGGDWTTRDPIAHVTSIDGQNLRRVGLVQRTSSGAPAAGLTMEGFTITRGRAQGATSGGDSATFAFGGGMLADASLIVLRSMTFSDNQAIGGTTTSSYGGAGSGGGLAIRAAPSGTLLEDIAFVSNRAQGGGGSGRGGFAIGGGLYTYQSTVTGRRLVFDRNVAVAGSTAGSGTAGGERGDAQGAGAAAQLGSNVSLSDVVVVGNQATGGNAGTDAGGAFGAGLYAEGATLAVSDADIRQNVALGGNGANGGIGAGGGIMGGNATITLDRDRVVDNRATGGNGSANRGVAGGGGVYLSRFSGSSSNVIMNSVVADNLAERGASGTPQGGGGGGLFLQGVQATIEHTTIVNNRLGSGVMQGEGLVLLSGAAGTTATVRYSIIAQHGVPAGPAALHVQPGSTVNLTRGIFSSNTRDSNADGSVGAPGTFNGLASMLAYGSVGFVSPGAPSFDYHLQPGSPAIDQATGSTATVDLDGAARVGVPDIGADEAGVS
jgi:hypothetical protein